MAIAKVLGDLFCTLITVAEYPGRSSFISYPCTEFKLKLKSEKRSSHMRCPFLKRLAVFRDVNNLGRNML